MDKPAVGAVASMSYFQPKRQSVIPLGFVTTYVATCCIVFAILACTKAIPNWDMLGYIASIYSLQEMGAEEMHSKIYTEAKSYLSAEQYDELLNKDSYRQTMAANAELFVQQIPYYQIRWLFLACIAGLSALGMSVFMAGHVVAASSAALAGFILYKAFQRSIAPLLWLLFPLLFALSGALETARMYSPDAMSLLVFAMAFLSFSRGHWSFFLIIALAVFVRTDLIVLVALCVTYTVIWRPHLRIPAILGLASAIGFYWLINSSSGNHGYAAVHYYVFGSNMQAVDPRTFAEHALTLAAIVGAIISNITGVFYFPALLFFGFCSLLGIYIVCVFSNQAPTLTWQYALTFLEDPRAAALVIGLAYLAAHFLMFPLLDTRFFAGPYFIAALCCLSLLSQLIEQSNYGGEAS